MLNERMIDHDQAITKLFLYVHHRLHDRTSNHLSIPDKEGTPCLGYYVAQGPTPSTRCSNSPELVGFLVSKSLNEKTPRAELRVEQKGKTPAPNLSNYKLG